VHVDGEEITILGGEIELQSDMPAEYIIDLVQWPYLEKTIKVTANAASYGFSAVARGCASKN
jgi:hypothetical protein